MGHSVCFAVALVFLLLWPRCAAMSLWGQNVLQHMVGWRCYWVFLKPECVSAYLVAVQMCHCILWHLCVAVYLAPVQMCHCILWHLCVAVCLAPVQMCHCILWHFFVADHLVGLVVKASVSRAEDPGFESCLHWDFSGVESYQWL